MARQSDASVACAVANHVEALLRIDRRMVVVGQEVGQSARVVIVSVADDERLDGGDVHACDFRVVGVEVGLPRVEQDVLPLVSLDEEGKTQFGLHLRLEDRILCQYLQFHALD